MIQTFDRRPDWETVLRTAEAALVVASAAVTLAKVMLGRKKIDEDLAGKIQSLPETQGSASYFDM